MPDAPQADIATGATCTTCGTDVIARTVRAAPRANPVGDLDAVRARSAERRSTVPSAQAVRIRCGQGCVDARKPCLSLTQFHTVVGELIAEQVDQGTVRLDD